MVLVGGLLTAAAAGIIGWNDESGALRRLSYWTLLAVAFPGWIVMRVGAEWIASKEGLDNLQSDPTLAQHRLHDGRRRRRAAADLADPRRHRAPQDAHGRRQRADQGDAA